MKEFFNIKSRGKSKDLCRKESSGDNTAMLNLQELIRERDMINSSNSRLLGQVERMEELDDASEDL